MISFSSPLDQMIIEYLLYRSCTKSIDVFTKELSEMQAEVGRTSGPVGPDSLCSLLIEKSRQVSCVDDQSGEGVAADDLVRSLVIVSHLFNVTPITDARQPNPSTHTAPLSLALTPHSARVWLALQAGLLKLHLVSLVQQTSTTFSRSSHRRRPDNNPAPTPNQGPDTSLASAATAADHAAMLGTNVHGGIVDPGGADPLDGGASGGGGDAATSTYHHASAGVRVTPDGAAAVTAFFGRYGALLATLGRLAGSTATPHASSGSSSMPSSTDLLSDWSAWFSLPYQSHPQRVPALAFYFSPSFPEQLQVSLRNFLKIALRSAPLPRLLRFNVARAREAKLRASLDDVRLERDALTARLARVEQQLAEAQSRLAEVGADGTDPSAELLGVSGAFAEMRPTLQASVQFASPVPQAAATTTGPAVAPPASPDPTGQPAAWTPATAPTTPLPGTTGVQLGSGRVSRSPSTSAGAGGPFVVRSRQALPGHSAPVTAVSLSPTAERLATCCADGYVRVWSTATTSSGGGEDDAAAGSSGGGGGGSSRPTTPDPGTAAAGASAFSGSGGGTVASSPVSVMRCAKFRADGPCLSLAWESHRRRLLFAGTASGTVALWDDRRGRVVGALPVDASTPWVRSITCQPAAPTLIAVCSSDTTPTGVVNVWDIAAERYRGCIPAEVDEAAHPSVVASAHSGAAVVVGSASSGFVHGYNPATLEPTFAFRAHAPGVAVRAAAYDPLDTHLLTVASDGTARLWDTRRLPSSTALDQAASSTPLHTFYLHGQADVAESTPAAPAQVLATAPSPSPPPRSLTPDGFVTIGSSSAPTARPGAAVLRASGGARPRSTSASPAAGTGPTAAVFDESGRFFCVGSPTGHLLLYEAAGGRRAPTQVISAHGSACDALDWQRGLLVSGASDSKVNFIRLARGRWATTVPTP